MLQLDSQRHQRTCPSSEGGGFIRQESHRWVCYSSCSETWTYAYSVTKFHYLENKESDWTEQSQMLVWAILNYLASNSVNPKELK